MTGTLSILGLYNFDSTIFDNFRVPASLNKEDVIADICLECAELEIIYPEVSTLKTAIGIWSVKMLRQWEELQKTLEYSYNPIENYDRYEEFTDISGNQGVSSSSAYQHSDTYAHNDSDGHNTTDQSKAGFNTSSLAKTENAEQNGDTHSTDNGNITGSDASVNGSTSIGTQHHVAHLHGNIGVTTAAQMIKEQREIVQYSVQDIIVKEFKQKFCILVY